jgi:hypothetical protein
MKDFYVDLNPEEEERITRVPTEVSVNIDLDADVETPDIEQIKISGNIRVLDFITSAEIIVDDN